MIEALVFDLDGTLIDSHRDIATAVNETLRDLGREPRTLDEIKRMIGHGVTHLLSSALETADPVLIGRGRERFVTHYRDGLVVHTTLYPGVLELLHTLVARGITVAIATNKPAMFTTEIVRRLELDRAGVAAVASADEAGARKPDPAVLRLALARAGAQVDARRVAYAGDMPVDVATARAFGARAVGVAWGFCPEEIREAGAEIVVETPQALGTWLTTRTEGGS